MARIIIEVDDPLCLDSGNEELPILFLGAYVKVEIEGRELERVYALDRSNLRDNNTIWLLTGDMTLEVREIEPVFKGTTHLLLRDEVEPGDKLIVSNIATPVAGMKVRPEGMGGSGQGRGGGKGMGKSAGMKPQEGAPGAASGTASGAEDGQRPAQGGTANVQ